MDPIPNANATPGQWPDVLMDAVIQSDIMGLSVLSPEYSGGNNIENFRWVIANKLVKVIAGGKEVVGKRYTEVFPSAETNGVLAALKQVFLTGRRQEHEIYHDDGIVKGWLRQVYVRSKDFIIVSAEDITDVKKADEEKNEKLRLVELNVRLKEIDNAKTKFFNNISHEFRTPLSLILAPLHDVIRSAGNPLTQKEKDNLLIAERNALRLQKLVNSLLDFARIEAGVTDAIFQPTDLVKFTGEIIAGFRSIIEEAGLKFTYKFDNIERVYINREMWEKIVLNLLSNAFKFTLKGKIEVHLQDLKHRVQLVVRDTGSGIAPRDINKIFERFVMLGNPGRRTQEGTGIGLSLVKELVAIHGGVIKVKSKKEEGSSFTVHLKKGKTHLRAAQVFETKATSGQSNTTTAFVNEATGWLPPHSKEPSQALQISVMVVDDNADMRQYITQVVSKSYDVVQAENGRVALDMLIKGYRPSLIISDVMMPEVDGYDLVNAVKKNPQFINIPIILLSARTGEDALIEGMEAGADDYLEKPFSSRELLAFVTARIQFRNSIKKN